MIRLPSLRGSGRVALIVAAARNAGMHFCVEDDSVFISAILGGTSSSNVPISLGALFSCNGSLSSCCSEVSFLTSSVPVTNKRYIVEGEGRASRIIAVDFNPCCCSRLRRPIRDQLLASGRYVHRREAFRFTNCASLIEIAIEKGMSIRLAALTETVYRVFGFTATSCCQTTSCAPARLLEITIILCGASPTV